MHTLGGGGEEKATPCRERGRVTFYIKKIDLLMEMPCVDRSGVYSGALRAVSRGPPAAFTTSSGRRIVLVTPATPLLWGDNIRVLTTPLCTRFCSGFDLGLVF